MSRIRRLLLASVFPALSASLVAFPDAPNLRQVDGASKSIVVAADEVYPKHGEQTAILLNDGRILLLWSQFARTDLMPPEERPPASPLRKPGGDDTYARICGKTSADGGTTWSDSFVVVDDQDALVNCISPGITRMADGRLMLAYSWRSGGNSRENYGHCAKMVRFSSDEGKTWSDRVQITPPDDGYHTGCHDRAYALSVGRVIVQCHTLFPPGVAMPGPRHRATCMGTYFAYSDDFGKSWKQSPVLTDPISPFGGRFEEASMVERADGSLIQFIRNWRGQSFVSESHDHGSTWSPPKPSGVFSALSPACVVKMPDSADLVMIWNPTWNPDAPISGRRSVLACAVSKDGGRSWGLPKALETNEDQWAEYPSVIFVDDRALIFYRVFDSERKRGDMVQVTVSRSWFYEPE